MVDFTSALYLGLRHPSFSLRPWSQFTTGVPAALAAPPDARTVAQAIAHLQGCERGTLGTSTLHLFWDLFGMLAGQKVAIYLDAGTYPIARWGVERAAGRRVPVGTFAHHDPQALQRLLRRHAWKRLQPLVVADGFCPGCGRSAPLPAYLDCAQAFGGRLILDDTQALGIFGHSPGSDAPYGRGGGGTLPWNRIGGPDVLVVSSLAKAFGVPMAVLSGSRAAVEDFESKSETRVHCSPPSIATVRAAEHALAVNRTHGDALRLRLAGLVSRLCNRAARAGLRFAGGLFPVQTLAPSRLMDGVKLHERLLQLGVRAVLHHAREGHGARLSFLVTARHLPQEIDLTVRALAEALPQAQLRIAAGGERQ
jgi:8-amino-7-oxononanoate synthase